MIAIVHSIYSQSVHAPARDAGLMDNDIERYCIFKWADANNMAFNSNKFKYVCFTPLPLLSQFLIVM